MKRAERLHALEEALRRSGVRGCTAEWLAREFGVSARTVKRDLDALERSGSPIWSRPGPGGGYGLAGRSTLPPVTLTPAQAVALLAAVRAASDAPYADLAAAGVAKIVDVLDPRTRLRADELARRVWVDVGSDASPLAGSVGTAGTAGEPRPGRAVRSALEEAMADQLVVRIHYTSAAGDSTVRDVEPVIFARRDGRWYLIGWCRLRDAMRWFLIARVSRASLTREACTGHSVAEVGEPPASARWVGVG